MIVLKNAFVIDGTGSPPTEAMTLVINGNRIETITTGGAAPSIRNTELPSQDIETVIDMKDSFLIPGLIDAHVHFGGTDALDHPGIGSMRETYDYLPSRTDSLRWGVTAIRSAGDYTPDIIEFRDAVKDGFQISPRIFAAGKMIQARGGHPIYTVFGSNSAISDGATVQVDESTDLEKEIERLAAAGVDWIKAVICEVDKLNYPAPVPRIPPEKIAKIIDLAHKHGKPCMIHVDNASHLREAVAAGADSIEHIFAVGATDTEIDDSLIDLLVKTQVHIIPTLISIKRHESPGSNRPLVYEKLKYQVGRLIAAGVNICAGTDSSIPSVRIGESIHDELEELVACGMTSLEAIKAATHDNAALLRASDCIGSIKTGYFADLIALSANPMLDIRNTKTIRFVIANGHIVSYNP